jgi:hypothetical protein
MTRRGYHQRKHTRTSTKGKKFSAGNISYLPTPVQVWNYDQGVMQISKLQVLGKNYWGFIAKDNTEKPPVYIVMLQRSGYTAEPYSHNRNKAGAEYDLKRLKE